MQTRNMLEVYYYNYYRNYNLNMIKQLKQKQDMNWKKIMKINQYKEEQLKWMLKQKN